MRKLLQICNILHTNRGNKWYLIRPKSDHCVALSVTFSSCWFFSNEMIKIYTTKKFYSYMWHHDFWQNYSAPSITAEMTSWLLLLSMAAFPLIKVTEILLKSWLVGSLSSQPFFLARACPSRLTTSVATQWNPPRVSTARGENLSPWVLQASAVSLIFRS